MEEQGHTCTEKTLLIKLMRRMSVDSHLHTHTHTDYVIPQSGPITMFSNHNWLLSLFIHEATLFPQWTPLFGMEAVALFSFPATEADELSFQEGDIIKVTEMEDDSGWFTAEIQGKRGYIPQNYISLLPYPWFVGRVSRLEAEKRLRCQDTGVFLVRESESAPGEFSVSVSYGNRVEHFRVLEGGGQYCIWEETFCSLNRLVDFYRTHSIAVDKAVCLRDPPSSPQLHVQSGCNPYPNPYKNCSQESLHTAHLHSPHERESGRQLDLGKTRLAHALCDYTPPHTAHLHFLRGDVIDLLDCSSALSWRGRCRGRVGVFPPACVQPLHH